MNSLIIDRVGEHLGGFLLDLGHVRVFVNDFCIFEYHSVESGR